MRLKTHILGIHVVPWAFILACLLLDGLAIMDHWLEGTVTFTAIAIVFALLARHAKEHD